MFRVRKRDVHASSTKLEVSRPRQPRADVQADTGLHDDKKRDNTTVQRRQRKAPGRSVPRTPGKRQEKKALAFGHYGKLPNAKRAVDIAKWYWETYQLVVIPAVKGKKFPIEDWKDIHDHKTAEHIWLRYESGAENNIADFNYACLTGPSGVTVIDFDTKEAAARYPLDTLTIDTPRGVHYYLRITDKELGNSVDGDNKIDIRSKGGVAILPPSLGTNAGLYRLTNDAPILDMSYKDFLSYLRKVGVELETIMGEARNEVGWFAETYANNTVTGERNTTCAKLAGYLLNKNLTVDDVLAIMDTWGIFWCDPQMVSGEIKTTVESIAKKHEREKQARGNFYTEEAEIAAARSDPDNRFA